MSSSGVNWKHFSSVQSLSHVRLFAIPWTAACQASLSITNSQSLLKFMSIESVMPSNHLILCRPLILLPSIFSSIRVFSSESFPGLSSESVLHIRWPKYWSFSFSISPSNEYSASYSPVRSSDRLSGMNACGIMAMQRISFENSYCLSCNSESL